MKKPAKKGRPGARRGGPGDSEELEPLAGNRRSLTHVGGRVRFTGTASDLRSALEHALQVTADDAATRAHLHGFHSYPARLHPTTARRLVEALTAPGQVVLDPFCGSGTVVIESRLSGRRAFGSDLNPLAVELASFKATVGSADRGPWLEAARDVAAYADERREAKAGPLHRYGKSELESFDIHVLLELDSIAAKIADVRARGTRRALLLAFSAILTKVSRRAGDSASYRGRKRIAAGYTAKLFERKVQELAERADEYAALLGDRPPSARIFESDARELECIHPASVHAVITSPPYPGTFDYLAHHEERLRWLRLSATKFSRGEIGARRHLEPLGPPRAAHRWQDELRATLTSLASKLVDGGRIALVLADSVLAGRPVYADDVVPRALRGLPLVLDAAAAQRRPHVHRPTAQAFRERPRQEHVFILTCTDAQPRRKSSI